MKCSELINTEIPYFKISGSYEEMGRQHGETFSLLIQNLYNERLNILLDANRRITVNDLKVISEGLWNAIEHFDIRIAKEVLATASACGLSTWQMIIAGGYSDLLDLVNPHNEGKFHECTVAINPNEGFIAGTWDSHTSAMDSLIILERHPNNEPATLALTTAGWPCQQGVNSNGIAFAITNLTPRSISKSKLVYIAANAGLCYGKSVKSLTSQFSKLSFCSGHSYIILDKNDGAIIETTGDNVRVMCISELKIMTNHYIEDINSIDDNSNYQYLTFSQQRSDELGRNILNVMHPNDFSECLAKCKLVNRSNQTEMITTCAHFYISINDLSIWYSKGPAKNSSRGYLSMKKLTLR